MDNNKKRARKIRLKRNRSNTAVTNKLDSEHYYLEGYKAGIAFNKFSVNIIDSAGLFMRASNITCYHIKRVFPGLDSRHVTIICAAHYYFLVSSGGDIDKGFTKKTNLIKASGLTNKQHAIDRLVDLERHKILKLIPVGAGHRVVPSVNFFKVATHITNAYYLALQQMFIQIHGDKVFEGMTGKNIMNELLTSGKAYIQNTYKKHNKNQIK